MTLSLNFGASGVYTIVSNIPASGGFYSWTIPTNISIATQAWLVVSSGLVGDYSNNPFSIVAPGVPVSGVCGLANGVAVSTVPTTNLCLNGTASSSGTGPWTWSCSGVNGGATATCSAPIAVTPTITVTSPNGGETWAQGSTHDITWTSTGVSTVTLSLNFGASGVYTIVSNIPASGGFYSWTIPTNISIATQAWLVVSSGLVGDYSNNPFSIVAPGILPIGCTPTSGYSTVTGLPCGNSTPSITLTSPNGGETLIYGQAYDVTWTSVGIDQIDIELVDMVTNGSARIANNVSASAGTYAWTPNFSVGNYKIRLVYNTNISDSSNNSFSIAGPHTPVNGICGSANGVTVSAVPTANLCLNGTASSVSGTGPWTWSCSGVNGGATATCSSGCSNGSCVQTNVQSSITLTSPNGGEYWLIGMSNNITWQKSADINTVDIKLYYDGSYRTTIATQVTGNSYTWNIPANFSAGYKYKIIIFSGGMQLASSNDYFSIITLGDQPSITVISPNGGENLQMGQTWLVRWVINIPPFDPGYYSIEVYLVNNNTGEKTMIGTHDYASSPFAWVVPTTISDPNFHYGVGSLYKIEVSILRTVQGGLISSDVSNSTFGIIPSTIPSITVVSPNGGERWVIGSRQPITWESTGIDYVRVDLYKAGRFVQNIVAKGFGVGFSGDNLLNMSVAWTVPANLAVSAFSIDRSDDYKIRVSKFGDASIYDESNNNFSIIAP